MKALLIEWDPSTGKRAGGINPKDKNLRCNAWQNMEVTPAVELRIVDDNRDMAQYECTDGVTVLNGKDEINRRINISFPSKMVIEDELLYSEHFKEQIGNKKINIINLPDDRSIRLKELKNRYGIKGIKEIKPVMV